MTPLGPLSARVLLVSTPRKPGSEASRLIVVSFAWAALGLALALAVPWLGLAPSPLQAVLNAGAPLLTAALIVRNLWLAVRLVGLTGHTASALPLTLTQLLLFTLLFFRVAGH